LENAAVFAGRSIYATESAAAEICDQSVGESEWAARKLFSVAAGIAETFEW
jgi:hypothetical protein